MKENSLYFVKVKWYNDMSNEDITSLFYTFADSFADLGKRIDETFPYIEKIKIQEISSYMGDSGFLYVDGLNKEILHTINEINCF